MRKAIIEYPCNQGQHEATLLRNGDDLLEYFDYHIAWGCKIINLENDEHLESRTLEYMKSHDYISKEEFSYITECHRYDTESLTEIFLKFYGVGGEEVYVYTTGTNVNQMYDYLEAAIKAELSSLVIEFNAGIDDDIQAFIDHATACDITFKYTF